MAIQVIKQAQDAQFDGRFPLFPIETHYLNILAPDGGWDGATLDQLGVGISGYQGASIITTSDGYQWTIALKFEVRGRYLICVAFPCCRQNGQPDRSVAIYCSPEVTPTEYALILIQIINELYPTQYPC